MIMGRVTYEIMARAWPSSPGPLARPMNSLRKLVFSATLAEPACLEQRPAGQKRKGYG